MALALLVAACGGSEPEPQVVNYDGVATVDELEDRSGGRPAGSVPTTIAGATEEVDGPAVLRRAIGLTEVVTSGRFEVSEHLDGAELTVAELATLDDVLSGMPLVADAAVPVEVDVHVGENGMLRQVRWYVNGIDLDPVVGLWERGRFESTIAYRDLGRPSGIAVPFGPDVIDEADVPDPVERSPEPNAA